MSRKSKTDSANALKAKIVMRYGTISAFAAEKGLCRATVYAALKFRRNGATSRRIREEAA